MSFIYALIAVGFLQTQGMIAVVVSTHKTEELCVKALKEWEKLPNPPELLAEGVKCIKIVTNPGKPV